MSDDIDNNPIKILLLGGTNVGKSNLIRIATGRPFENEPLFIPNQYYDDSIIINNKRYSYNVWDTEGGENFRSLTKIFFNGSQIVLIVFSMTSKHSFEEIDYWYKTTKEILGEDGYIIALVGNKSDLFESHELSYEEIDKKAKELNIKYKITSAKEDSVGFKLFFAQLLEELINKKNKDNSGEIKTSIKLENEKEKFNGKSKNKCKN